MKYDQLYIKQKIREAIHLLAVGSGDVRSRLVQANKALVPLKKIKIPDEIQSDWEWIQKELNKYEPILREDGSIFQGSVEHTLSKIHNKPTGIKIAQRIWDMYLKI